MARIDWSVLSGPRVSRRTLLSLAAASGATGYASRLAAVERRAEPGDTSSSPHPGPGRTEARRHPQARLRHQPDPESRPGQGQPRHRCRRACLEPLLQPRPIRRRARAGPGSRRELDGQRRRPALQLHPARRSDLPQRRSAQSRRHRLHLRADDRSRLRLAPRQQAGAGRVGRYPGRSHRRLHPERALRAVPRRRRQPRPRPRPDADLATGVRGDGRGAVRPGAGRLRSLRHRRRQRSTSAAGSSWSPSTAGMAGGPCSTGSMSRSSPSRRAASARWRRVTSTCSTSCRRSASRS